MRITSILAPALLAVFTFVPSATTVSASNTSSNSLDIGLNVTLGAAPSNNKIYHWEIKHFPKSIAGLDTPFHLTKKMRPGRNPFDIARDPTSKKRDSRVLRSLYPANSFARSGHPHAEFTSTPLPQEAFSGPVSRFIRLEYQMYFQPGFQWVKGGKLPGILIGTEKGCNAACSGGGTAERCFSTRMMWRAHGSGELYLYAAKSLYFPKEKPEKCSRSLDKRSPEALFQLEQRQIKAVHIPEDDEWDEASYFSEAGLHKRALDNSCLNGINVRITPGSRNMCNPTYGISVGRGGDFKFRAGTWHNITQIVRVNSKGKAVKDGYLAVYLDRKPVVQINNLVLLKNGYDPKKTVGEDRLVKFMFSSFFGGADASYRTRKAQWIAWKGFKMTTSVKNIWH
ncbi:hypothetical protein BX616_001598 [Lobosporangium transversale]|uniref:Polysaccharide lyase 14 domain-containing protein n=1 Tax=Lobosporangium transversale TaxID=64571 RepID=A0A1Y2H155_9FUNG|nr:hypothetical protein BCR41DRAFT_344977 [Lobosporangium transversale]KAF9903527.1 hypothetical protein BX616_001598 [Lobosporangium transversale]ORZ28287.1 hypothetical protein BCR41DRAFT_344977 [Lobosporangium transversale]|eukprot:XP_021885972.1 hypothetical protein BCR41DRAFT_344977 [Lobosporangium transversale]